MNSANVEKKIFSKHNLPPLILQKTKDSYQTPLLSPVSPNSLTNGGTTPEIGGFYKALTPSSPVSPSKSIG